MITVGFRVILKKNTDKSYFLEFLDTESDVEMRTARAHAHTAVDTHQMKNVCCSVIENEWTLVAQDIEFQSVYNRTTISVSSFIKWYLEIGIFL